MANHASHASLPYPIKGARFTLLIPYLDADGDPTDPTTPDTEISKDGGAYADCAEEATTITGSNGSAYLTLSGAELDCSMAIAAAKVASGPKATLITLHPRLLADVENGTAQAGAAGSITLAAGAAAFDLAGCFVKTTGGTGGGGTGGANNQARRIISYNPSTKVATIEPNWETNPDATTTYDILLGEGMSLGALKALQPTTAGRTLDVSTGGEAGVDWANVGSPTTTVGLSGTTVKTATDVETDTADLQARLPAALVSGRIDASVGEMAANVVTAAAIATGAIDADAVADGAIDAGAFAANAITAAVLADGAIDRATFADDTGLQSMRAGTGQAGSTSTTIVLDAGASASNDFYLDQEIDLVAGTGAGQSRRIVDYVGSTKTATVAPPWAVVPDATSKFVIRGGGAVDVHRWVSDVVNAAISGRVDARVGALAANVITAASINPGAIDAAAIGTGAIDADALAANAITSAAIATDAIGAAQIAQGAADKIVESVSGTADSGTTTTLVDAARTEADTDYWKGAILLMTSGNLAGQRRRITGFNPATDTLTVDAAFTQAVATQTYMILRTGYGEAPAAGSGDWSTAEKEQIRDALGVDGTKTAATGGDVQDLQARLPAALVTGRIDASVGAMAANVITAPAIASDAITAAKIAPDALGASELAADAVAEIAAAVAAGAVASVTGAVGSVTGNVGGNVVGSVGSLATQAKADVNAEVDTALADVNLDHLVGTATGIPAIPAGTFLDQVVDDGTAAFDRTTDSLQAIRDRGDSAWGGAGGETRLREGTAQAGGASTITLDAGASATNDLYKNCICALVAGTGAGQSQIINGYVGATKVATMGASWAVNPDATTQFRLIPLGAIPGATAPTADDNAQAVANVMATDKTLIDRTTHDITVFVGSSATPRGVRRVTEVDPNTQGLIPQ